MNKKAMEMSVGLIVVLILSILIFSLSLYFIFKWFGQAEELKAEIDKQTREQILTALKSGNQLVAIPISIIESKKGNPANFGVGVRNIAAEGPFSMAVTYSGAYTPDGKPISVDRSYIDAKWLGNFAIVDTFTLRKNEEKLVAVLVKADINIAPGITTPKGDYIFNLCVYNKSLDNSGKPPARCDKEQFQLSADVFYTKKIYQLVVRVI
jgi:hypothetical protein